MCHRKDRIVTISFPTTPRAGRLASPASRSATTARRHRHRHGLLILHLPRAPLLPRAPSSIPKATAEPPCRETRVGRHHQGRQSRCPSVRQPRRVPHGRAAQGWAQICRDSSLQGPPGADSPAREQEDKKKREAAAAAAAARIASGSGGGGGKLSDWTTSVLIFGIWAGLMYYIFQLAPNQTPVRDSVPSCFLNCISMLCCEMWIGIPLLLLVSDNNRL